MILTFTHALRDARNNSPDPTEAPHQGGFFIGKTNFRIDDKNT
jgi:hypothetical protein